MIPRYQVVAEVVGCIEEYSRSARRNPQISFAVRVGRLQLSLVQGPPPDDLELAAYWDGSLADVEAKSQRDSFTCLDGLHRGDVVPAMEFEALRLGQIGKMVDRRASRIATSLQYRFSLLSSKRIEKGTRGF